MEQKPPSVHQILANSYMTYLFFCSVGLFADLFFPVRLVVPEGKTLATIFLIVGPLFILWAQHTSHTFEKIKQETGVAQFIRGPYKHFRNPTQIGLLFLVAGYALATGAIMLFCATVLAYVVSNIFFRKHESVLEERYGEPYRAYKKSIHKIL